MLSSQQEAALGERLSQQIEAWKPAGSAAQQRRVAAIGQRLLRQGGEVSYEIRFKVIDDAETVNAFAIPGGHVYVTTGMMRVADTDAQLASVLGHEIAHVTQRHIAGFDPALLGADGAIPEVDSDLPAQPAAQSAFIVRVELADLRAD